ncbi:MAG: MCE family protein [Pseudonocardiaceae bacterium]|nr:MCE family protein [Pseudonocardiaceae bacterium]
MKFLTGPWARLIEILAVVSVAAAFTVYLFVPTQVNVPLLEDLGNYTVAVELDDVDNAVPAGQVRMAGVQVGEIESIARQGQRVKVVLTLNPDAAPLHEGATVRVGIRSLVGETYVGIDDGDGAELPSGTTLPDSAVQPSVQLREVLNSLDSETRAALGSTLRSLGAGTKGSQKEVRAVLTGLGRLGREGHTALDAIAAQSQDLRALAHETTTLLTALDTSEGQIATMVADADRLSAATAGQRQAIENTMRQLPGVLGSADAAATELTELSSSLVPVAADLKEAAPFLSTALRELPATTEDLRGLLPALDGTLDRAPATLKRVPTLGADIRGLVPEAEAMLRDANPMLAYMEPYGLDVATFLVYFSAMMEQTDESGHHYARLTPIVNGTSAQSPLDFRLPAGAGYYKNPYPEPGAGRDPGPFTGEYPRLEQAPR